MMRAAVGSWVLISVFSAFVVTSALTGPGLPGTALRQPPLTPPPVGTCVSGTVDPVLVSCDEPHSGEVVLSWNGRVPSTPLDPVWFPVDTQAPNGPDPHCWQAAVAYVPQAVAPSLSPEVDWTWWQPPYDTEVVRGPGPAALPDWNWKACVVAPQDSWGTRLISDRSISTTSALPALDVPEDWRPCSRPEPGLDWEGPEPCDEPHRSETVASALIRVPDQQHLLDLRDRELEWYQDGATEPFALDDPPAFAVAECRTMVDTYLGGTLDHHADDLEVVLETFSLAWSEDDRQIDPLVDIPVGIHAGCSVVARGDRSLVGSVAGLGSRPVPWE